MVRIALCGVVAALAFVGSGSAASAKRCVKGPGNAPVLCVVGKATVSYS